MFGQGAPRIRNCLWIIGHHSFRKSDEQRRIGNTGTILFALYR